MDLWPGKNLEKRPISCSKPPDSQLLLINVSAHSLPTCTLWFSGKRTCLEPSRPHNWQWNQVTCPTGKPTACPRPLDRTLQVLRAPTLKSCIGKGLQHNLLRRECTSCLPASYVKLNLGGAGMEQWWERSHPTNVGWVWFLHLVSCGLSLLLVLFLLRGFFSGFSGFPPSTKTNTFKLQFDREFWGPQVYQL